MLELRSATQLSHGAGVAGFMGRLPFRPPRVTGHRWHRTVKKAGPVRLESHVQVRRHGRGPATRLWKGATCYSAARVAGETTPSAVIQRILQASLICRPFGGVRHAFP